MKKLSYLTIILPAIVMAAQSRKINYELKILPPCYDEGRRQGFSVAWAVDALGVTRGRTHVRIQNQFVN